MTLALGASIGLTVLVGLSLGLFGSGGSILLLPILVYVGGVMPDRAVAISLAVVGVTSALGAVRHKRRGDLNAKAMWLFAASGVPGAWLGSHLTVLVPSAVLMLIFSALMLVVGGVMLRTKAEARDTRDCAPPRCLAAGIAVGILTGFLGVGGGFLIVPALLWFGGVEPNTAVGTSLAVIAMNSAGGLLGHVSATSRSEILLIASLTAAAVVGMLGGSRVSDKIDPGSISRAFGVFVIVVAVGVAVAPIIQLVNGQ